MLAAGVPLHARLTSDAMLPARRCCLRRPSSCSKACLRRGGDGGGSCWLCLAGRPCTSAESVLQIQKGRHFWLKAARVESMQPKPHSRVGSTLPANGPLSPHRINSAHLFASPSSVMSLSLTQGLRRQTSKPAGVLCPLSRRSRRRPKGRRCRQTASGWRQNGRPITPLVAAAAQSPAPSRADDVCMSSGQWRVKQSSG